MRLNLIIGLLAAALLVLLWQALKPTQRDAGPELHRLSFDLAVIDDQTPPVKVILTESDLIELTLSSDYDAAVIASGHCGFGLGATPTAVMNMGTVVNRYGPSPQGFMVVPIVGAFFIDIVNLIILQATLSFIG